MIERILGWDLLRGLCAFGVGVYHLLMWLDVYQVDAIGSYAVYVFFVLSGASLTYNYGAQIAASTFSFRQFLVSRYLRLAPLYVSLMLVLLPWKISNEGLTLALLQKFLLNLFFLFGLVTPAQNAMLVGGWSLGIEAIFYLMFPLIAVWLTRGRGAWLGFFTAVALQFAWVNWALAASGDHAANSIAMHQVQAFLAYFFGGCILGELRRQQRALITNPWLAGIGLALGFVVLLLINTTQPGGHLMGLRGVVGFSTCIFLVWVVAALPMRGGLAKASQFCGDVTYGLYLIHPVIFFGLAWVVLPRTPLGDPLQWGVVSKLVLTAIVLLAATVAAWLSEQFFERPVRLAYRNKLR